MSLPNWNSNNSYNKYTSTYYKGVIDASGGDIINRTGNLNLVMGGIIAGSNTITNTVLGYLKNVNSDVQQQITNLAATLGNLVTNTQAITYSSGTTISGTLSFTGTLNSISPTVFSYISGLTSSAQTQISNLSTSIGSLQTQNTNQSYSSGTTTFSGTLASNTLTFSGTLNSISPTVFSYISGLTSSAQTQISNLSSSLSTANSNISTLQTNMTNIVYGSGYTNMNYVYINNDLISQGSTELRNTTTLTGNISANSQTVTPTQIGYLANVTSDIQTQLNNSTGVTTGAQTWSGVKTFSSPPVMSGASITASSIPDSALASNYVTLGGTQTISGAKTYSGTNTFNGTTNINGTPSITGATIKGTTTIQGTPTFTTNPVFSGNPSFTGTPTFSNGITATGIPIYSFSNLASPSINIANNNSSLPGQLYMNSGGASGNPCDIYLSGIWTSSGLNSTTQQYDVELAYAAPTSGKGLNITSYSSTAGGIRLTPSLITFNSPIALTGNITSNGQTVSTAQIGYLSNVTSDINSQFNSLITGLASANSSITTANTNISNLQTATTGITYNSSLGYTVISNPLHLTAYPAIIFDTNVYLSNPAGAPTSTQNLGYFNNSFPSSNISLTTNTVTNVVTGTIPAGIWNIVICFNVYKSSGSAATLITTGISTTSATLPSGGGTFGPWYNYYPSLTATSQQAQYQCTYVNYSGSTQNVYFVIQASSANTSVSALSYMNWTRIG